MWPVWVLQHTTLPDLLAVSSGWNTANSSSLKCIFPLYFPQIFLSSWQPAKYFLFTDSLSQHLLKLVFSVNYVYEGRLGCAVCIWHVNKVKVRHVWDHFIICAQIAALSVAFHALKSVSGIASEQWMPCRSCLALQYTDFQRNFSTCVERIQNEHIVSMRCEMTPGPCLPLPQQSLGRANL